MRLLFSGVLLVAAETPPEWIDSRWPNLEENVQRPLRYYPTETGFVITNGKEFFNRPLYCIRGGMRVDAGDRPEFVFHMPGRGGNLRLGVVCSNGAFWLHDAPFVVAFYEPGRMRYRVRDEFGAELELIAIPLADINGMIFRVDAVEGIHQTELVWAFGGANGQRFRRNADIGCEREPVGTLLQLRPEHCRGTSCRLGLRYFVVSSSRVQIAGVSSDVAHLKIADAGYWNDLEGLLKDSAISTESPVVLGRTTLNIGKPFYLLFMRPEQGQDLDSLGQQWDFERIQAAFVRAEARRKEIISRVKLECPDPFLSVAVAALNVASEAIWDGETTSYMHGAVAWRTPLLGWRGLYTGDALGMHERTFSHILRYASRQDTNPVPEKMPGPDPESNLARSERALHSNGNMTKSHYDMNLVAVDGLIRHIRWTGDLDKVRSLWPVLQRHFGWERRLFRRTFGLIGLPLYEAYACIWASDNLQYNGGGVAHSSAYNYFANREIGRIGSLLGIPEAHELCSEAEAISRAMDLLLWDSKTGCYGEYRDYLGDQRLHTNAALWTVYHAIDSELGSPVQKWLMTRYAETQIPQIPVVGPGISEKGLRVFSTTSWMPYMWSINNVVVAENMHASLAFWQADRPDLAYSVFKGTILATMFCGLCPGNIGMTLSYDVARREAQRDFADGIGMAARALVEGFVGVRPNLVEGEILIQPGWPQHWKWLNFNHPDFALAFLKQRDTERYFFESRFKREAKLKFRLRARGSKLEVLDVVGGDARVILDTNAVGHPFVEVSFPPTASCGFVIRWGGRQIDDISSPLLVSPSSEIAIVSRYAKAEEVLDPQNVLTDSYRSGKGWRARISQNATGHKTVFVKLVQDSLQWWEPVHLEIRSRGSPTLGIEFEWFSPLKRRRFHCVDLAPFFNARLTNIFEVEYLSPRSPFCSLSIPKQGIGGWCDYNFKPRLDDSGLRAIAATNGGLFVMPNGVPFRIHPKSDASNVVFVSKWDNYPDSVAIPLDGRWRYCFMLMAGSTTHMQSRFVNGSVRIRYKDGSSVEVELVNPINWWPIEQDYFMDDFAFKRSEPIPPRVDLKTGAVRIIDADCFKGKGGPIDGGAATVLAVPLDHAKEVESLILAAEANEVIIGLLGLTLMK